MSPRDTVSTSVVGSKDIYFWLRNRLSATISAMRSLPANFTTTHRPVSCIIDSSSEFLHVCQVKRNNNSIIGCIFWLPSQRQQDSALIDAGAPMSIASIYMSSDAFGRRVCRRE